MCLYSKSSRRVSDTQNWSRRKERGFRLTEKDLVGEVDGREEVWFEDT